MGRTILLADDSVTIQKVVELTFMDEDYEVVAVSNGDDALRALDDLGPDLVITDLHMPGADGFEVCRRAKEMALPVLLLVGTFEPFQQDEADAAGVDGVVKKPFDSQELLQRVSELMQSAAGGSSEPEAASDAFEIETSPWVDAEEHADDPVEVEQADGLISTDTIGATVELPAATAAEVSEAAAAVSSEPEAVPEPAPAPSPISERFAAISGESLEAEEPVNGGAHLSAEDVDRVARRVVELLGETTLREVAWEVVPDLAEVVIKDRIRELERQIE